MVVNWNATSKYPILDSNYYTSVAATVPQVGQDLADILVQLNLDGNKIHCIGFSLGERFMF